MSQSAPGVCSDDIQDDHEDLLESESDTDNENYEAPTNHQSTNERFDYGHPGLLDDDTLFDLFKKSSSQESPEMPEVEITGVKTFNSSCTTMAREVDSLYDETGLSCFKNCEKIGFQLGSSADGKEPRRPKLIKQPNSYYRNFSVNNCNVKFITTTEDLLAYECIMFYGSHCDYASNEVINYDNVRVSYQQLATLRCSNKVSVDKFVINAFYRKLFKDKHPKDSRRHFFFSTVGDYLVNHDLNQSYLYHNCGRCFKSANGCFKFTSSEYLFFPILHDDHWFVFVVAIQDGYFVFLDSFHEDDMYQQNIRSIVIPNFVRAWDEFIGTNWNFHEFCHPLCTCSDI